VLKSDVSSEPFYLYTYDIDMSLDLSPARFRIGTEKE
jgi:hypothetical protein